MFQGVDHCNYNKLRPEAFRLNQRRRRRRSRETSRGERSYTQAGTQLAPSSGGRRKKRRGRGIPPPSARCVRAIRAGDYAGFYRGNPLLRRIMHGKYLCPAGAAKIRGDLELVPKRARRLLRPAWGRSNWAMTPGARNWQNWIHLGFQFPTALGLGWVRCVRLSFHFHLVFFSSI